MLGARVAFVPEQLAPRFGDRQDDPPAVARVGITGDQAARLERAQRRAHRLRADLLHPGQLARGGRAVAVQPGERGGLRHGELARHPDLAQPPQQQAHADAKRRRHITDVKFVSHILRLN
jgi:hypothetical protein